MPLLLKRSLFFTGANIVSLALAVALAFIAPGAQAGNSNSSVLSLNNQSIMLAPGQNEFSIRVPSNPTTGYQWFLKSHSELVMPEGKTYQAPKKALPGQGGYDRWHFRVSDKAFKAPQALSVTLVYRRPWEQHSSDKTTTFQIHTVQSNVKASSER